MRIRKESIDTCWGQGWNFLRARFWCLLVVPFCFRRFAGCSLDPCQSEFDSGRKNEQSKPSFPNSEVYVLLSLPLPSSPLLSLRAVWWRIRAILAVEWISCPAVTIPVCKQYHLFLRFLLPPSFLSIPSFSPKSIGLFRLVIRRKLLRSGFETFQQWKTLSGHRPVTQNASDPCGPPSAQSCSEEFGARWVTWERPEEAAIFRQLIRMQINASWGWKISFQRSEHQLFLSCFVRFSIGCFKMVRNLHHCTSALHYICIRALKYYIQILHSNIAFIHCIHTLNSYIAFIHCIYIVYIVLIHCIYTLHWYTRVTQKMLDRSHWLAYEAIDKNARIFYFQLY